MLKPQFLQRFVRQKWKRYSFLDPSMPDFEAKTVHKNPRPGGQRLFSPKQPNYEKCRKIYWPFPACPTWTTPQQGEPENESTKTHTQKQAAKT